jgi:hypothetical protein
MTLPASSVTPNTAIIDGVDVDAVAVVVQSCAGVSGLDGGQFGEVATYLPGRTVEGVVVSDGRVRVQVRSKWGIQVSSLATQITTALAPLTAPRPVDVVIADIDDPPSLPPPHEPRPARRSRPDPGLPSA